MGLQAVVWSADRATVLAESKQAIGRATNNVAEYRGLIAGLTEAAELGATTPMGRPGTAEEVAQAILWLLDDRSSYCTGTFIDVSGGR